MGTSRPVSRAATAFAQGHPRLGPLTELPGLWMGSGFKPISRPDSKQKQPFFLEINGTQALAAMMQNAALTTEVFVDANVPNP
jgi:hypothetical protein